MWQSLCWMWPLPMHSLCTRMLILHCAYIQACFERVVDWDYCSKRRPGRSSNLIRTMPLQHHPFKVQNQNGGFKRGRCALHMESRKRKDTQWFCHDCVVWLCHPGTEDDDCYFKWHKRRLLQSTARPCRHRVSR